MADNRTSFQKLGQLFLGGGPGTGSKTLNTRSVTYNIDSSKVLYQTDNKADYERKKMELKQQHLLNWQWKANSVNQQMQSLSNLNNIQLMYRDADLMANEPEIGAALDIVMEETCNLNSKGKMLNVYSKSKRIQSILEDLFVNRLDVNIMLPMVCREMVKYGNCFMLLNISNSDGILGWRHQQPYTMQRLEDGYLNPYSPNTANVLTAVPDTKDLEPHETRFLFVGQNESIPFHSWQVAHFRNLSDTLFLPYGTSWLHKARRAWRVMMMMEDAMLIYRLDKSIERRIFKINVGGINEQDVQAYINQVADNFKRTPIIDPATGQVDLRKNFLDVSADYFIPVRNGQDPSSIEALNGAQWQSALDDIEYMHNKVLAALRIPKTFLNFAEPQGKGQNLSIMDVRFARMVQRVQQSLLMELNKIAIIHLYLMGFTEDLTNFTLVMNNPSAQIDALEMEEFSKRVQTASPALADPGIGMPLLSLHRVLRDIFKMTDEEIKDNLNEIRLEKALAAELQMTNQVIKKTGIFNPVDRIYGDPHVMYKPSDEEGGPEGGPGGAGGEGADGGILNSSSLGGAAGDVGTTGMESAPSASAGMGSAPSPSPTPAPASPAPSGGGAVMESIDYSKKAKTHSFFEEYLNHLNTDNEEEKGTSNALAEITNKNIRINETFNKIFDDLDKELNDEENNEGDTPQVL